MKHVASRAAMAQFEGVRGIPSGCHIAAAGLMVGRRRPQTASGVTFATLEDEHGMINE